MIKSGKWGKKEKKAKKKKGILSAQTERKRTTGKSVGRVTTSAAILRTAQGGNDSQIQKITTEALDENR